MTIGNFDGVHLGHQALLHRARDLVGRDGSVIAVTFEPHPHKLLRPDIAVKPLQRAEEKQQALQQAGADEVRVLEVTPALLGMSATDFINHVHREIRFDCVVEGPDFHFGKSRSGDLQLLRSVGAHLGFRLDIVQPVQVHLGDASVAPASSSLVRWLLAHGRVEDVARVLGRPFTLAGSVVRGDQRGRELGWPTCNVQHGDRMVPADGVYAGVAELPDASRRRAAISVGTKPTFGGSEVTVEAFLLDHQAPLDHYGWQLTISFERWLREQTRCDDVHSLCALIQRDVERTREEIPMEALSL